MILYPNAKINIGLNILRKRNPYLLDPLVEEILIEKSATGRSAWIRLFDDLIACCDGGTIFTNL